MAGLMALVSGVGTVVLFVVLWLGSYPITRDTDALQERAQVAADREDMLEYLQQLRVNMEKYGMTSGHAVIFFPTPANDLELQYRGVQKIIERLEQIKSIPKNETAYQTALDDIRGTLREMPRLGSDWYGTNNFGWIVLFGVLAVICIGSIFVALATSPY